MAKGREKKKQHFVPSCYLGAWCDPTSPPDQSYVWLFSKGGGEGKRKGPGNTFTETDMYTIVMPDGTRSLRVEDALNELENRLKDLRVNFIEKRKQLPLVRHIKLVAFISAMMARTPAFREHHRAHWAKLVSMGDEMIADMATKTPEEKRKIAAMSLPSSGASFTMEQARELADRPLQNMLLHFVQAEVPVLAQMQLEVLNAPPGVSFITSDAPATRFDPEAHKRPFFMQGPGLMWPTIEIWMPLSPQQGLLLHHSKPMTRGIKSINYIDVSAATVAHFNERVRAFATDTLVSHQNALHLAYASRPT